MKTNHFLSLAVAKMINAEIKQCWHNSAIALLAIPDLEDWNYVEGFAIDNPFEELVDED